MERAKTAPQIGSGALLLVDCSIIGRMKGRGGRGGRGSGGGGGGGSGGGGGDD